MKRISFFLLVTLLLPHTALAAGSPQACAETMVTELTDVRDEYRSFVFGSREETSGTFAGLAGGVVREERKGIFETKKRLTSELVEPLVESYRSYRCRSLAVCQVAAESFGVNGGDSTIKILGCEEEEHARYGECYLAGTPEDGLADAGLQEQKVRLLEQCQRFVERTLAAERAALQLAVGYDSGYRSLLQLAGIMEWVLKSFSTGALKSIGDMVNLLGKLHQIPCFITQCDHPNVAQ